MKKVIRALILTLFMTFSASTVDACVLSFSDYEDEEIEQAYIIGDYIFDATNTTPSLEDLATAARSIPEGEETYIYNVIYIPAFKYYSNLEIFTKEESTDPTDWPNLDVKYLYKNHIKNEDYNIFTCTNDNILVNYLTLSTVGESDYKTSAERGLEITSDKGISKIKYCFTSSDECEPNEEKIINTEEDNYSVTISYPASKEEEHICAVGYDKEGNASPLTCDNKYLLVDDGVINITSNGTTTIKEGKPESVSTIFDIEYPVSGGKVYYYYYNNNKKYLLSSLSDLPSGDSLVQVIGRAGNGLRSVETQEVTVEKFKVTYDSINEEEGVTFKEQADLTKTATKEGYKFVGWNTDKDAQDALDKLEVTEDTILYPIFEKEVTATYKILSYDGSTPAVSEYKTSSCIIKNGTDSCDVIIPSITSKVGYTALGWSNEEDKQTPDYLGGESLTIKKNTTVYSVTRKNTAQTVTVYYFDGTKNTSKVLKCNLYNGNNKCLVDLNEIPQNTYNGREPSGYTTTTNKITKVETNEISSGEVYYEYYLDEYSLTFNDESGSNTSTTNVNYIITQDEVIRNVDEVTIPTGASKEGYTFTGWRIDEETSSSTVKANDKVKLESNTTYNAIYTKEITLTYESSDTSDVPESVKGTIYYNAGIKAESNAKITFASGKNMTKVEPTSGTKYIFEDWKINGVKHYAGETIEINNDVTAEAEWIIKGCLITFDYKTNGGTSADIESAAIYGVGSSFDVSNIRAYKPGWTFIGWSKSSNAHTNKLSKYTMENEDTSAVTLYAMFSKDITINLQIQDTNAFYYTGETEITNTIYNRETATAISLPSLMKNHGYENYTMVGWSTKANTSKAEYDVEDTPSISENITYYSVTKNNTGLVTTYNYYKDNNLTTKNVTCYRYNGNSTCQTEFNPTDTYNNLSVSGWSTSSETSQESDGTISENTNLYAIYKNVISVDYYSYINKGTHVTNTYLIELVANPSGLVNSGVNVSLESPDGIEGYTASGWRKDAKQIKEEYVTGSSINVKESIALYGVYNKTVEMTYVTNGGTPTPASQSNTVYYNTCTESKDVETTFTLNNKVTKTGYDLVGWSPNVDLSGTIYTNEMPLTTSSKVYAKWKEAAFNLTYDYKTNGGTNTNKTESVTYLSKASLYTDGTKDGYEFVGWNTDKDATEGLSEYQMPSHDATLYAIYKKKVTATWIITDSKAATVEKATTECYKYNNNNTCSIETGNMTTNAGYTSVGWTTTRGATASTVGNNMYTDISKDTTYYSITKNNTTLKGTFYYMLNGTIQTATTECALYNGATSCTLENPLTPSSYNGASFINWSSNAETNTEANLTVSSNQIYYAHYLQILTVTYHTLLTNTTSTETKSLEYLVSTSIKSSIPSINVGTPASVSGYTASGWREDTQKTAANVANNTSFNITSSKEYYAIYTRTLSLSYNANTGSSTPSTQTTTQYYNAQGGISYHTFTLSAAISKTGYTFDKWALGSTSGTKYAASANVTINADSKYYATWTANTYTITYVLDSGANGSSAPTSGTYDSNVTISNPTRTNYTFTGWSISGMDSVTHTIGSTTTTDTTATNVKDTSFKNLRSTSGTVTFTANWSANNLTVTSNGYSGTYDGKEHSISVSCTDSDSTIYYSTDNKTWSTTNPSYTNAGTYTVYYKVTKNNYFDNTGSATVSIAKATGTISANNNATIYALNSTYVGTTSNSDGAMSVVSNSGAVTVALSGSNIYVYGNYYGAATVSVYRAASTNYTACSTTFTVSVLFRGTSFSMSGGWGVTGSGTSWSTSVSGKSQSTYTYYATSSNPITSVKVQAGCLTGSCYGSSTLYSNGTTSGYYRYSNYTWYLTVSGMGTTSVTITLTIPNAFNGYMYIGTGYSGVYGNGFTSTMTIN